MSQTDFPCAVGNAFSSPIDDELLVHIEGRVDTHLLDALTTQIWRRCDGRTSIASMAADLPDMPADQAQEAVRAAVDELVAAGLVEVEVASTAAERESRRRFLKKAAVALVAVPTVTTIVTAAPAAAVSAGGPCSTNSQCDSGLVCRGGVCASPGGNGAVCDEQADCQAGFYCATSGPNPNTCQAKLANNAACTQSFQCTSGCCRSNGNASSGKDTCRSTGSGIQCYNP